jgi:hypothetical protein
MSRGFDIKQDLRKTKKLKIIKSCALREEFEASLNQAQA